MRFTLPGRCPLYAPESGPRETYPKRREADEIRGHVAFTHRKSPNFACDLHDIRELGEKVHQTILDKITFPGHLKDVPVLAAYHHEKMDGSGPYKLAGDAIPIQSRIIAVADVFDALVSARVYKKPLPPEQALTILEQGRNLKFDPLVIDTLKSLLSNIMAAVYGQDDQEADLAA